MAGRPKRADGRSSKTVANNNYTRKAYDRLAVNVKKGQREVLKAYADEQGVTLNIMINRILADNVPGFDPILTTPEWVAASREINKNSTAG